MEILKVHAKKVKLGPDVDLERLAKVTPMFSGADLAAIVNEAAIRAVRGGRDTIENVDFKDAITDYYASRPISKSVGSIFKGLPSPF